MTFTTQGEMNVEKTSVSVNKFVWILQHPIIVPVFLDMCLIVMDFLVQVS